MKIFNTLFGIFNYFNNNFDIKDNHNSLIPCLLKPKDQLLVEEKVQQVGNQILAEGQIPQTGMKRKLLSEPTVLSENEACGKRKKRVSASAEDKTKPLDQVKEEVIVATERQEKRSDDYQKIEGVDKPTSFFIEQEPAEWYPLEREADGKIKVVLPHALQNSKRILYIFRNREKQCFLIGETGTSLNTRIHGYVSLFNRKGSEAKAKGVGVKTFLTDVKQHPEHFDVGILYTLQPEEDLHLFETLFIDYKRTVCQLYNDRRGGGGGLAHAEEEPTIYAIPKPEIAPFTPEKYYPYHKDEEGNIRPHFSPGFEEKIERLRERMEESQQFTYAIKKLDTHQRYTGVTNLPVKRSNEHAYEAEYQDPKHPKYDPSHKSGLLHTAMAEDPTHFGIGLLPVQSLHKISPRKHGDYLHFPSIAKVEEYSIKALKSLYSQNGFNCNKGGGGPLPRSSKKRCKKKLSFL